MGRVIIMHINELKGNKLKKKPLTFPSHQEGRQRGRPMKAHEELQTLGIERCPECHCAVGDDWEYKDFSNKTIVVCPQCREEINLSNLGQEVAQ